MKAGPLRAGPMRVGRGWLAGGLVLLAARSWGLPLPLWGCPLRHLTGVPCPTCFLTRSVMATFRGDLIGALQWHAFGPPLVMAGLWFSFRSLPQRPKPRPLDLPIATRAWSMRRAGWIAAGLLLGYWLVRLALWWRSGELPLWVWEAPLGQWWAAHAVGPPD